MNSLEKFRALLAPDESAVIFSEITRQYLSGFSSTDGVLFITPGESGLYLDSRYREMALIAQKKGQIPQEIRIYPYVFFQEFGKALAAGTVKKVLFEDQCMTVADLNTFQKNFPAADFRPMGNLARSLRVEKSEEEIARIAASQSLAEAAFLHILEFISPRRTESEIAAELEHFMKRGGASGVSFDTICISGTKTSLPHGVPEEIRLTNNAFLTMDFGCRLDGYCSDMTRTVCLGRATDEMREIYGIVLRAQEAALGAIRAGVKGSFVDKAARDVIAAAGFGDSFGHSTGHGIGLEVHEAPAYSPRAESEVPEGAVLSVEPGIYLEGKFGVRIEDLAVVCESGCRNLNSSPKSLLEL